MQEELIEKADELFYFFEDGCGGTDTEPQTVW